MSFFILFDITRLQKLLEYTVINYRRLKATERAEQKHPGFSQNPLDSPRVLLQTGCKFSKEHIQR